MKFMLLGKVAVGSEWAAKAASHYSGRNQYIDSSYIAKTNSISKALMKIVLSLTHILSFRDFKHSQIAFFVRTIFFSPGHAALEPLFARF